MFHVKRLQFRRTKRNQETSSVGFTLPWAGVTPAPSSCEGGLCGRLRGYQFCRMCTLAIYFRVTRDCPVVIAANRDEFLDRPAVDPTTLLEHPHVVGGKDLRAGGTWLGISENGLVGGLLNRRAEMAANPDARSRGLLCLDALRRRPRRTQRISRRRARRGLQSFQPADRLARCGVRRV